jgi:hypothetical protein
MERSTQSSPVLGAGAPSGEILKEAPYHTEDVVDPMGGEDTDVGSVDSSHCTSHDSAEGDADEQFDPIPCSSTGWQRNWFLSPKRLGQQSEMERCVLSTFALVC